MASKKQLVQSDLQQNETMSSVDAGFIGFGAKTDGLYKKNATGEFRLLSTEDFNYTPENADSKVSEFQDTPDDTHYPSEKLVWDELSKKENKNSLTNIYYATNFQQLSDSLTDSQISGLPSVIYAGGEITFTNHLEFLGNKQVEVIGTPHVIFNLANKKLIFKSPRFTNVLFKNPHVDGYIEAVGGGVFLENVTFMSDSIDSSQGGTHVPHIITTGDVINGTSQININGIRHQTSDYILNTNNIIQPIWVKINQNSTISNCKLNIKNVDSGLNFFRYSNVLVTSSVSVRIDTVGDESWRYHSSQQNPGEGLISNLSTLNKISTVDDLYVQRMATSSSDNKELTVDNAGNVHISLRSVIRVATKTELTSIWGSLKLTPPQSTLTCVYNDGVNNGFYYLNEVDHLSIDSWVKFGSDINFDNIDTHLGIDRENGSTVKFLNEQGNMVEIPTSEVNNAVDNDTITGTGTTENPLKANIKIIKSELAPETPTQGQRWVDTTSGIRYEYLDGIWVEFSAAGSFDGSGGNYVEDSSTTDTTILDTDVILKKDSVWKSITWANVKSLLNGLYVKLDQTVAQTVGSASARLINLFSDKIQSALYQDLLGNNPFVSQNGGTSYHIAKWFTTTQPITIASNGLSASVPAAQFTAGASQVGAKLTINGYERIITTPNPTTTVVYVTEAFPIEMRGQSYSSGLWGVYSVYIKFIGTDVFIYNHLGVKLQSIEYQSLFFGQRIITPGVSLNGINSYKLSSVAKSSLLGYREGVNPDSANADEGFRQGSNGQWEIYDGVNLGSLRDLKLRAIKTGLVLETQLTTATNNTAITSIAVDQTTNFPATGTILIGGVTSVNYTSKTATSLVFASTVIPTYAAGTAVLVTSAGDYVQNDANGIRLFGAATQHRDEYPSGQWVNAAGGAAPDEVSVTIATIATRKQAFDGAATTESKSNMFEIPHDMAIDRVNAGTDAIEFHIHGMPSTTGAGTARFTFRWCYSPPNGNPIAMTAQTVDFVISANTQYKHMLSGVDLPIPAGGYAIGGKIDFTVERNPSDAADTYGADFLFDKCALHVPLDTIGSVTRYGKYS